MEYMNNNKEAWEEAFDKSSDEWCGNDIINQLETEEYPFIEKVLVDEIINYDFSKKTIAQFCCNNGRELMSIMKFGGEKGVGFDIAENMISFANQTAEKLGVNCTFVATNILEIDREYYNSFDYIFVTIGALTWFEDLNLFFDKVSQCLKKEGQLIINEMHPTANMLGAPGEDNYDKNSPNKLVYSYFRKEPWIENDGMGYMDTGAYKSKTFQSYSHTFADILNSICQNGMKLSKIKEFDYDISGMFSELNNIGIPLSYLLVGKKR
ncbi:class I SAM-dependent methyltransferase [Natronospora cellulosivora (SeqCode)]